MVKHSFDEFGNLLIVEALAPVKGFDGEGIPQGSARSIAPAQFEAHLRDAEFVAALPADVRAGMVETVALARALQTGE